MSPALPPGRGAPTGRRPDRAPPPDAPGGPLRRDPRPAPEHRRDARQVVVVALEEVGQAGEERGVHRGGGAAVGDFVGDVRAPRGVRREAPEERTRAHSNGLEEGRARRLVGGGRGRGSRPRRQRPVARGGLAEA